jgi:hypothetical protein
VTHDVSSSYDRELGAFLNRMGEGGRSPGAVRIYHTVRNIPYASRGSRQPAEVLQANEGSCSGKHLLLRDLLRRAGEVAEIETVEGDFAAGMPEVDGMPPRLRAWLRTVVFATFTNTLFGQAQRVRASWTRPGLTRWRGTDFPPIRTGMAAAIRKSLWPRRGWSAEPRT